MRLTATAPAGRRATSAIKVVRVARRKLPPVRRLLEVRAVREGDDVVVTWRTRRPARRQGYTVEAQDRRHVPGGDLELLTATRRADGRRTRWRARLRDVPSTQRFVRVTVTGIDPPYRDHTVVVPIAGT